MSHRPSAKLSRSTRRPAGPVRYAVIGLGHIAQVAVLPGFAQAKNSVLAALVSGDQTKLEKLQREHDVAAIYDYDHLDDCFASPDLDAVFIALPNDMHFDCCLRAVAAGKHVLCEKPLALSVRDAEEMLEAARSNGVKLMTAYRLHFEPANLSAIELVRSGKIGEPRYFSSTFSYQLTDPNNIRTKWERGGGPVFDIGTYCINAARYLFGDEPEEVTAMLANSGDPRFREVEESACAILRFPRGRLATFTVSFGSAEAARYELVGTKGSIVLDPAFEYSEGLRQTVKIGERESEKVFPKTDQFAGEIEAFSECILNDTEPEASAREAIGDLRVIEAIFESAETGRTISLEPFTKKTRPGKEQVKRKPGIDEPKTVRVRSPHD
ncbi:MAG: gfo/Idh/MocA family oxidoreductase [Opitutus sp.]|nr:gfo/Idh/MocA family oxidoreductase [Opitutus sp.]